MARADTAPVGHDASAQKKWGEHCLPSSFVCDVMERKKWIVICKSSKY